MCQFFTPEWLTAFGTIFLAIAAFAVALFGEQMSRCFLRPDLHLQAVVQRPDSEKVPRFQHLDGALWRPVGDAYFFRLGITNKGNTAAKDVQVVLAKVERIVGDQVSRIDRITPMNLKWSNIGVVTRKSLMPDLPPVFCDFIHVHDPESRKLLGEDLPSVSKDHVVLCFDVEAAPQNAANLLEPGTYRIDVRLVAENFRARRYSVEVWCPGPWFPEQVEMFDKGFKMKIV